MGDTRSTDTEWEITPTEAARRRKVSQSAESQRRRMAKRFKTLPPQSSERDRIKVNEVPEYLKKLYGMTVSPTKVLNWTRLGRLDTQGRRVYLLVTKMERCRMVLKVDLDAFLTA